MSVRKSEPRVNPFTSAEKKSPIVFKFTSNKSKGDDISHSTNSFDSPGKKKEMSFLQ